MKVFRASYYENRTVYFMEYERIVVAESEDDALKQVLENEDHTKERYWMIEEIYTGKPSVFNIWDNYSE